ncbi:helix-turn-helix domain-containing protein [Caminicella sporogenes]|uniref:helix-turn-helix domain-containing protein n=1 Tax=Caminicella sporogenes TaxID=166485 RepID=UPI00254044B2|nr:helix-turn-helix transcriptional regulator [Caminicella sporogenes]WIF95021.1 helix-turn-helix transcriptional regulator [Caminicella sporogenes]
MSFGQRLKELRINKNITQSELANILNKSRSTIAGYEINDRMPDFETLTKIADFFNVSIDYLLGRTDIQNPNNTLEGRKITLHQKLENIPEIVINTEEEYIQMYHQMYDEIKYIQNKIENINYFNSIEDALEILTLFNDFEYKYENASYNDIENLEHIKEKYNNLIEAVLQLKNLTGLSIAIKLRKTILKLDSLTKVEQNILMNYFLLLIEKYKNKIMSDTKDPRVIPIIEDLDNKLSQYINYLSEKSKELKKTTD